MVKSTVSWILAAIFLSLAVGLTFVFPLAAIPFYILGGVALILAIAFGVTSSPSRVTLDTTPIRASYTAYSDPLYRTTYSAPTVGLGYGYSSPFNPHRRTVYSAQHGVPGIPVVPPPAAVGAGGVHASTSAAMPAAHTRTAR